jgi:CelD/BcsL family acetyltransferase involved in cellulose biosynthesis
MSSRKRPLASTLSLPHPVLAPSRDTSRAGCQIRTERYTPERWARVADDWARIFAVSAQASFFLHPDWVQTWLEVFASTVDPLMVTIENGGDPAGICLLARGVDWQGPFPVRRLYLNTAGEPQTECVCSEFNGLLCRPGWERAVANALAGYLQGEGWEEFVVRGVTEEAAGGIEPIFAGCECLAQWSTDYYVDLETLRSRGGAYVDGLSRNTRAQVKRAMRLYQEAGPILVTVAESPAEVGDLFRELVRLHQETWTSRGEPGAFGAARVREFHERLIARAAPRGAVQLLRVSAGGATIGVLYQFLDNGRVYFYQSGLNYTGDNRYKPGLVTHAAAIEYWRTRGLGEYHFLAGEDFDVRYKRSLATDARTLGWLTFQRRSLKLRAIARLRRVKRRLRAWF